MEYEPGRREAFLKDNCSKVEQKGFMKPFTQEQLLNYKEQLVNISIQVAEIELKKRCSDSFYNGELKPLKEERDEVISNIKQKATYVEELCYVFTDQDAKETGYYNADWELVDCRPATADELQPTLFNFSKTGTND